MRIILLVVFALLVSQSPTPEVRQARSEPSATPIARATKLVKPRPMKGQKLFTKTGWLVSSVFEAQEPYPGQSGHKEPPPGWFCRRPGAGVPKNHECFCDRKFKATPEDPSCCYAKREEIKTCTVWCWEDYCLCGTCQKPQSSQHHHP